MSKKTPFALALALAMAAAPVAPASAQMTIKDSSAHPDRPTKLDFTGSFGFVGDNSVGLAGWVSIPLAPDGFIPPINDSFYLEFGTAVNYAWYTWDYSFTRSCSLSYTDLVPMAGVRWNFHLTEAWTVFAKLKGGVGYQFGRSECNGFTYRDRGGLHFASDGGVGAYWNFSPGMGMRFDLGYQGAAVGISINM